MPAAVPPSPWLAVDPLTDRVQLARAVRRDYDAVLAGAPVPSSVRAVVAQSWARSGAAGIDPEGHRPALVLDEDAIAERWHEHPLYPVLPVLRDLLSDATTQSGHMLVLSDADGVLLWMEGHRRVLAATEEMHFVVGADWSEAGAGTNALGTAIAVDHPVQIFSAEHFSKVVHPWQCSGAPIHDPETGEILGVVDLTGHLKTAHPHTLALVSAAAGMAEAFLRQGLEQRRALLRDRFRARVAHAQDRAALLDAHGTVLEAEPGRWVRGRVVLPDGGGEVRLPDGTVATAEPLDGGYVLWGPRRGAASDHAAAASGGLRIELLRTSPRVLLGRRELRLSRRHAELLCVLLLRPEGLTAEQLALELYGEAGRPVSVRAELSRLRRELGTVLQARPYRLAGDVAADVLDAEALVESGDLDAAVARCARPLLPGSDVPVVCELRDRLEGALRAAVLDRGDPALLARWCATPAGRDDVPATELLLARLPVGDPRRPEAEARLTRLRRVFADDGEPAAW